MKNLLLVSCLVLSLTSCKKAITDLAAREKATDTLHNQLTETQIGDGWQLLFNGTKIEGWHKYGTDSIGQAWEIDDQSIHLNVSDKKEWQAKNGGDIISGKEYTNFHFKTDWKIAKNGNSGLIFYVKEEPATYKYPWMTGPEMQVLDNSGHPDSKIIKHRAGDLYDLITATETVKPAEEWNTAEIIANNGNLQFFLNGEKVLETTMWDDAWRKMIALSKFVEFPGFGTFKTGKLCLQDHGDKVWYRNIMIKEL